MDEKFSHGTDSDGRDHAAAYVFVDLHWSADHVERGERANRLGPVASALKPGREGYEVVG